MAGLNLTMGINGAGGVGVAKQNPPATVGEAAFGPGYSSTGMTPSSATALAPNDPFGVAFWTGVGALALLLVIRHSLPS